MVRRLASMTPRRVSAAAIVADVTRTAAPRTTRSSSSSCDQRAGRADHEQADDHQAGEEEQRHLDGEARPGAQATAVDQPQHPHDRDQVAGDGRYPAEDRQLDGIHGVDDRGRERTGDGEERRGGEQPPRAGPGGARGAGPQHQARHEPGSDDGRARRPRAGQAPPRPERTRVRSARQRRAATIDGSPHRSLGMLTESDKPGAHPVTRSGGAPDRRRPGVSGRISRRSRPAPPTRRAWRTCRAPRSCSAGATAPSPRGASPARPRRPARSRVRAARSSTIRSPSRTNAIGPPSVASGATWPMHRPVVPPENRPSVSSRTSLPRAGALDGAGDREHLAHARAAARALVADDDDVAGLQGALGDGVHRALLAVEDAGGALEGLGVEAGRLHDRALGGQRAAQDDEAAGLVDRVVHRVDDRAVRVRRGDLGQVLGHRLAGHGERVAVQQTGVQQGPHHDRHAADAVDVGHDVPAERLDVGQVRRAVADPVEVLEREVDLRLVRDRQQVQDGVGGAAERHDDGDRVLERLLGHDLPRRDALAQHVHDGLAGGDGEGVAAAVGRRRRGAARQAHAERLGRAGHRVGGVHAAAGALARAGGLLDRGRARRG